MAVTFLTRCDKSIAVRTASGTFVNVEECDITVSQLVNGSYRCYKCPDRPRGNAVTDDPRVMLMHAVDHLIAGLRVPCGGLKRLAAMAVQQTGAA